MHLSSYGLKMKMWFVINQSSHDGRKLALEVEQMRMAKPRTAKPSTFADSACMQIMCAKLLGLNIHVD